MEPFEDISLSTVGNVFHQNFPCKLIETIFEEGAVKNPKFFPRPLCLEGYLFVPFATFL